MKKQPGDVPRKLNVQIDTFDQDGLQIGTRVVDLFHYGTKAWLNTHTWWAMNNGHTVRQQKVA